MQRARNRIGRWLERLPLLGPAMTKRRLRDRFGTEIALIEGRHEPGTEHPSILHFSVNKAATQYVKRVLRRCGDESGLCSVQLHEYAFHSDFPYLDRLSRDAMRAYQHVFRPRGYLYGPFGGMIDGIDELEQYLIFVMLRDPRDVLTSEFFSTAYSHGIPGPFKRDEFQQRRERALGSSIDDYVLSRVEPCRRIYQRYLDALGNGGSYHLAKYEEMIADFPSWLDGALRFLQLPIPQGLRDSLIHEATVPPPKENVLKHKRRVLPGDHLEKLQPRTIDRLNDELREVLAGFGYG